MGLLWHLITTVDSSEYKHLNNERLIFCLDSFFSEICQARVDKSLWTGNRHGPSHRPSHGGGHQGAGDTLQVLPGLGLLSLRVLLAGDAPVVGGSGLDILHLLHISRSSEDGQYEKGRKENDGEDLHCDNHEDGPVKGDAGVEGSAHHGTQETTKGKYRSPESGDKTVCVNGIRKSAGNR